MTPAVPTLRCPVTQPGSIAAHGTGDRHSLYVHLRQDHPVYHDPALDLWVVARYEEIDEVLRDRSGAYSPAETYAPVQSLAPEAAQVYDSIAFVPVTASTDPPIHTRFRRALTALWPTTAGQLQPWQKHIEAHAVEAAEEFAARPSGFGDLESDYTQPLASRVMGDMIGIPAEGLDCVTAGSSNMSDLLWGHLDPATQHTSALGVQKLWNYCLTLIDDRKKHPQDDLITGWLDYQAPDGDNLTREEIASMLMEVLSTNAETTSLLISTTLHHLLTTGSYTDLVRHPEQIPGAVEETLRHDPPLIGWLRCTTRETTLGGTRLPAGVRLLLLLASAAEDEHHGLQDPHVFDPRRPSIPTTLNLGAGSHFCPGALYVRLTAAAALEALTRVLPALTLHPDPGGPTRAVNTILRTPRRLPVTWATGELNGTMLTGRHC